jgi:hypothetical protein
MQPTISLLRPTIRLSGVPEDALHAGEVLVWRSLEVRRMKVATARSPRRTAPEVATRLESTFSVSGAGGAGCELKGGSGGQTEA